MKKSFGRFASPNSRVKFAVEPWVAAPAVKWTTLIVWRWDQFFSYGAWGALDPSNQLLIEVAKVDKLKTSKTQFFLSHLASDYSYTSGRTAREKGFFMGILDEDELLPNNSRPSREGTWWFSHSREIVSDSRRGWLGSSFITQRMNPSR